MKVRQGRKNPHNLYFQLGEQPSDSDISIGYIREARWAKAIVDAVNANGGVVPPANRSFTAETDWSRSEELRVDRLGPEDEDVKSGDPDRPSRKLR